jgi:uncharacterized membrane protein
MSDPHTVEVVTDALRAEATTWDAQATTIAGVASWVSGQTLQGAAVGVFFAMGDTYEAVRSQIATWCAHGSTNMAAIAAELRRNATAYESTDVDVTQTVEGAY